MKYQFNIYQFLILLMGVCLQIGLNAGIVLKPDFSTKSIDYKNESGETVYGEIIDGSPEFVKTNQGTALLLNGVELSYPAWKLINLNYGTISFDIKPLNWEARRWRKGDAKIIPLVYIGNDSNFNRMQLFIASSSICFYSKYKNQQIRAATVIPGKSNLRTKDKWVNITMSWTPQFINLYLDGRPVATASYGLGSDRQGAASLLLRFMPLNNKLNPHKKFSTQIRNIKVLNKSISPAEIKAEFELRMTDTSKILTQSSAFVPNSQTAVDIDGKVNKQEWADATRLPLLKLNGKVELDSNLPAWVYIKHDNRKLYIAYEIKNVADFTESALANKFSKKVFNGNVVEFYCRRADADLYKYYQFAVAPNNAYAVKTEKGKWGKFDFKHRTSKNENSWFMEMAIPLKSIGLKSGQSFKANFGLYRANCDSLSRSDRWLAWSGNKYDSYFKNMGDLTLATNFCPVRLKSIGDMNYGILNFNFDTALTSRLNLKLLDGSGKVFLNKSYTAGKEFKLKKKLKFKGCGFFFLESRNVENGKVNYNYSSRFFVHDPFNMKAVFNCEMQQFNLDFDLKGLRNELKKSIANGKAKLYVSLKSKKTGKIYGENEISIIKPRFRVYLKCRSFPQGEYTICANVDIGRKQYSRTKYFHRPNDIFLHDRKGMGKGIPRPWKALKWHNRNLATAFHRYKFGNSPFPENGSSREIPILKNSEITIASAGIVDKFIPLKEYDLKATEAEVVSDGEMLAKKLKLKLKWRRTISYDGLIRYDFALLPLQKPVSIDKFRIIFKVPYKTAEYAFDPHSTPSLCRNWTFRDKAEKRLFPTAWLTNGRAGLCVFTDNNANWVYSPGELPLMIKKDKSENTARIVVNLIGRKVKIKEKTPYVLGVMATPAKPPRSYWRQLHTYGAPKDEQQARKGRFISIRGWNYERKVFRWFRWILLTRLLNPEAAKKRISQLKQKGIKSLPYACGALMPEKNSLYDFYGFSWRRSVDGRQMPECEYSTGADGVKFYGGVPVCANNSGYRDYMAYYTDKFLRDYDLVGLYLDFGGVYRSDKPYRETDLKERLTPGRPVMNFNTFGVRDLYERLRKVIQKRNPEYYLWIHDWDRYHPAVVSFADIIYPGEEFMHSIRKNLRAYIEDTPLETWRAAYNSEIFGAAVQFLNQYRYYVNPMHSRDKTNLEKIHFARDLVTLLLLHDITMSAGFVRDIRYQLDMTDIKDAEFYPYYQQDYITSGDNMVKVSYYSWKNKKDLILVVGNLKKQKVHIKLCFNKKAFLKAEAVDLVSGENVDLNKKLEVGDYNFRLLKIIPAEQ